MAASSSTATSRPAARPSCRSGSLSPRDKIAAGFWENQAVPAAKGQYDATHLARNPANFAALSPLNFLSRAASVFCETQAAPAAKGQYGAPHPARNPANFAARTPLNFLARAAAVYPDKVAVIDGRRRFTYGEFGGGWRRF